jgi:hypothetical protein
VSSTPRELEEGRFQSVIDDAEARTRAKSIKRLVLCSGKVYVDLISNERRAAVKNVAIVRVEQLYPFPAEEVAAVVAGYPNLQEILWVQEEPQNMGAWTFVRCELETLAGGHRFAFALQPARHARFHNGLTELGNDDVDGHGHPLRRRGHAGFLQRASTGTFSANAWSAMMRWWIWCSADEPSDGLALRGRPA